jgi:hypothetical protein
MGSTALDILGDILATSGSRRSALAFGRYPTDDEEAHPDVP